MRVEKGQWGFRRLGQRFANARSCSISPESSDGSNVMGSIRDGDATSNGLSPFRCRAWSAACLNLLPLAEL
jgi:hypothetical protein